MTGARFPHSETPGSQPGCRLPGAYRRLQRPSSAPGAKASTVCPSKLGTTKITLQTTVTAKSQKQEMLASTVQFSRNRRNQAPPAPLRDREAPAALKTQAAPVPSGPNSVPTPAPDQPSPFRDPPQGNAY